MKTFLLLILTCKLCNCAKEQKGIGNPNLWCCEKFEKNDSQTVDKAIYVVQSYHKLSHSLGMISTGAPDPDFRQGDMAIS